MAAAYQNQGNGNLRSSPTSTRLRHRVCKEINLTQVGDAQPSAVNR